MVDLCYLRALASQQHSHHNFLRATYVHIHFVQSYNFLLTINQKWHTYSIKNMLRANKNLIRCFFFLLSFSNPFENKSAQSCASESQSIGIEDRIAKSSSCKSTFKHLHVIFDVLHVIYMSSMQIRIRIQYGAMQASAKYTPITKYT